MKRLYLFLVPVFSGFVLAAQTNGAGGTINNTEETKGSGLLANPVVWAVGATVFMLLLVVFLRSNSSNKDKV